MDKASSPALEQSTNIGTGGLGGRDKNPGCLPISIPAQKQERASWGHEPIPRQLANLSKRLPHQDVQREATERAVQWMIVQMESEAEAKQVALVQRQPSILAMAKLNVEQMGQKESTLGPSQEGTNLAQGTAHGEAMEQGGELQDLTPPQAEEGEEGRGRNQINHPPRGQGHHRLQKDTSGRSSTEWLNRPLAK